MGWIKGVWFSLFGGNKFKYLGVALQSCGWIVVASGVARFADVSGALASVSSPPTISV